MRGLLGLAIVLIVAVVGALGYRGIDLEREANHGPIGTLKDIIL